MGLYKGPMTGIVKAAASRQHGIAVALPNAPFILGDGSIRVCPKILELVEYNDIDDVHGDTCRAGAHHAAAQHVDPGNGVSIVAKTIVNWGALE